MYITIKQTKVGISKALYALQRPEVLLQCFGLVFSECGLVIHTFDKWQIVHYPGGMLDKVGVAVGVAAAKYTQTNLSQMGEPYLQPDVYSVQLLPAGNRDVTVSGVALKIHLKAHFYNKRKLVSKVQMFLEVAARIAREHAIVFVEYDEWGEFVRANPQYAFANTTSWDRGFIYDASAKQREKWDKWFSDWQKGRVGDVPIP